MSTSTSTTREVTRLRLQVEALTSEVRDLKATIITMLTTKNRRHARDEHDLKLVRVLVRHVEDRAFSAREVIAHALIEPELNAALETAFLDGARSLGKLLVRREQRQSVDDDVRLERVGQDRDGVIWRLHVSRV